MRKEREGGRENTTLSSNRLFVLSTTLLKPLFKSCLSQSPRPKKHQKAIIVQTAAKCLLQLKLSHELNRGHKRCPVLELPSFDSSLYSHQLLVGAISTTTPQNARRFHLRVMDCRPHCCYCSCSASSRCWSQILTIWHAISRRRRYRRGRTQPQTQSLILIDPTPRWSYHCYLMPSCSSSLCRAMPSSWGCPP